MSRSSFSDSKKKNSGFSKESSQNRRSSRRSNRQRRRGGQSGDERRSSIKKQKRSDVNKDYTPEGFLTLKDLQKPHGKVVGPEFFSDLKTTPDQPLLGDSQAEHLVCCYCHHPIKEMSLAVDVPENESPAHFDCVIERLKSSENLQPGESVIYMGNRRFAVVVYTDKNRFDIVREIPFEDTRDFKPWRNAFSVKMRKQLE